MTQNLYNNNHLDFLPIDKILKLKPFHKNILLLSNFVFHTRLYTLIRIILGAYFSHKKKPIPFTLIYL